MNELVKDVTDDTFELEVVERSKEVPVVVDLWAPWCGPCRQLTPLLEQVLEDRSGDFELVKVNVDENPVTAAALGARSIPLVIGFSQGTAKAQFVGVQPTSMINQLVDSLAPSEVELRVIAAEKLVESGDAAGARKELEAAIQLDHRHEPARLALGRLLINAEMGEDALKVLSPLASNGHDEIARLRAEIHVLSGVGVDLEELAEQVKADPDDLSLLIRFGVALGANHEMERALEVLLHAVSKDPAFEDGAARKAMLDIFNILGKDDPLTKTFRSRLAQAVF